MLPDQCSRTFWAFSRYRYRDTIKVSSQSHQYRKSHCWDKTILRLTYLHHGISLTGKIASLYWIGGQIMRCHYFSFTVVILLQFLFICHNVTELSRNETIVFAKLKDLILKLSNRLMAHHDLGVFTGWYLQSSAAITQFLGSKKSIAL